MHPLQRARRHGNPRNRFDQVIRIPLIAFARLFGRLIQNRLCLNRLVRLHDKTLILCFILASLDTQGKAWQEFSKRHPRRKRIRSTAGCFATRFEHLCCCTWLFGYIASSRLGSTMPSGFKQSIAHFRITQSR
jgi:hypothetical protein